MTSIVRLFQFPTKASPVPADIVYIGNSASAFDESQCTITQFIGTYPNLLALGQMSADIDLGSHKLVNVQDPTAVQDAATKNYVDTIADITLPENIQNQAYTYEVDTGAANAIVLALSVPLASYQDGQQLLFRAIATNTGATTANVDGLGLKPVVLNGNVALTGGEIVINGNYFLVYNSSYSAFVLK